MAQAYWTAEDYNLGDTLVDIPEWDDIIDVTGAEIKEDASNNKYLELAGANSEQSILQFIDIADAEDAEVWARIYLETDTPSGSADGALIVRGQQLDGRSTMDLYGLAISEGSQLWAINKLNDGSNTLLATDEPDPVPGLDSIAEALLQVSGSTVRGKLWDDGTSEPGSWTLEETDATITGAGGVGVYNYRDVGLRIYEFGVGTGGDSAPRAPVADTISGTVTLSGSAVENARVYLIDTSDNSVQATTLTDASGNYSFTSVPSGTYDVLVRYVDGSSNEYVQGDLEVVIS